MAAGKGSDAQTIVIKRVKKGGHGHHGGSWKVAFADFATAMMAFFLLLWLMGSTTEEQKGAISEYFNNPSAVPGSSTAPSPTSINGPGGASTSMIALGGGMELHRTATAETNSADAAAPVDVDEAEKIAEALDRERLESLLQELNRAIEQRESLAKFKDQILLDVTPEGVRIQIIDHERRSMFPLGSPVLEAFADTILRELATVIDDVPNRISISGHTDIRPYGRLNYSNWELSADRANAARRSLIGGGLTEARIGRVVGLASSVLLDPQAADNPINRRISIVVMNKRTEDAIHHENGSILTVQDNGALVPAGEPVAAVGQ
ncbi:flagellar motor protein MotB [Povalibacter sp.]|uniref:flagellar motor protein MotB n=1 Tax=Povalibacter sp. TaxID=1962978 RepID=UPI002F40277F